MTFKLARHRNAHLVAGDRPDWRQSAACRTEDPDLFFPHSENGQTLNQLAQTEDAKAICAQCPVLAQCREWALGHPRQHGIAGGLSEYERISLRRAAARRTA